MGTLEDLLRLGPTYQNQLGELNSALDSEEGIRNNMLATALQESQQDRMLASREHARGGRSTVSD